MTDGVATAQNEGASASPDFEAARRHYRAAEQAVAAGNHALAAAEYGMAYDITKDPVLFFKIGQAHDRAGDCRSALVYYRRYLEEGKPSPEHRQRTEALAAACKNRPAQAAQAGAAAEGGSETTSDKAAVVAGSGTDAGTGSTTGAAAGPAASPVPGARTESSPLPPSGAESGSGAAPVTGAATGAGTGAPLAAAAAADSPGATDGGPAGVSKSLDRAEPSWQKTAAWTSIGAVIALGTTAAVLGLSADSRQEDIQNLIDFRDTEGMPSRYTGATRDRYRDLVREGDRLENFAIVAAAATGAAAVASAAFFLLEGTRSRDEGSTARPRLAPAVGPGQAGLTWSGSF